MLEISLFYSFPLRLTKQFIISVKLSISEFLFFYFYWLTALPINILIFPMTSFPGLSRPFSEKLKVPANLTPRGFSFQFLLMRKREVY